MNKRYVSGRKAEYKTIKLLKQQGWYPIRSAGSKGLWDVVAYCQYGWLCVQVKTTKPTKRDFEKIEVAAVPPPTVKHIWQWQRGAGLPIVHIVGDTNEM